MGAYCTQKTVDYTGNHCATLGWSLFHSNLVKQLPKHISTTVKMLHIACAGQRCHACGWRVQYYLHIWTAAKAAAYRQDTESRQYAE